MSVLDDIRGGVREDLEQREREVPLAEPRARVNDLPAPLDPLPAFCAQEVSIVEMKRQIPSKGALAEIADPALLAVSTKPVVRR